MQSGKCLSLVLAVSIIVACAPNQALTDTKKAVFTYAPVSEEFDVKLDNEKMARIRVVWTDYQECKAKVFYSRDSKLDKFIEAKPVQPLVVTETDREPWKLISCGALGGNQRCETCLFAVQKNPIGVWIYIGGIPYFICIYGC